jgi:hypothetical protein
MLVLEPKTPWWYTNAASSPVSIGVHHNVLFDCHGNLIQFSFQFKFWIHGNKNIEYFFTCSIIFHYLSFNNTLSYPRPHTNLNLVSLLLWILIWLSLGIQKKKEKKRRLVLFSPNFHMFFLSQHHGRHIGLPNLQIS